MVGLQNAIHRAIAWLIVLAAAVACQPGNMPNQPVPTTTPTPTLPAPTPSATTTPSKPPSPPDWTKRWLQGVPCRAPCWEGITPGKTTASEALEILNRSPLVAVAQQKSIALMPELGRVFWSWADGREGGYANYGAKDPAQVIYGLSPLFPDPFRFQDVLQAYGEPSHIVVIAERPPDSLDIYFTFWVVYLPRALVLEGGGRFKPQLGPDMSFDKVTFFVPTEEGLKQAVWVAKDHSEWVIPWQGFRGYEFYCRDITGGMWCRGETKPR